MAAGSNPQPSAKTSRGLRQLSITSNPVLNTIHEPTIAGTIRTRSPVLDAMNDQEVERFNRSQVDALTDRNYVRYMKSPDQR